MKGKISTVFLIIVFLVGISLLLYPTVSDRYNSYRQSKAISKYNENVEALMPEEYSKMLSDAEEYNRELSENFDRYSMTEERTEKYESLLNGSENGIMSYIEIPSLNCLLPVYHGVDEEKLQVAIGHLPETSLPVGGESTHCVLSGHRGLTSAKLFTNIDKLSEGDIFILHTLKEVLVYEVDRILTVEPDDVEPLEIERGKDYVTLLTCTPYGINTHRLLVRGHRINTPDDISGRIVSAEGARVDPQMVATVIAVPPLVVLFAAVLIRSKKKKRK